MKDEDILSDDILLSVYLFLERCQV